MERIDIDGMLPEAEGRRESARRRLLELAGAGGLADAEAQEVADEAVRRARSEAPERAGDSPAPSLEETRERLGVRDTGEADLR